MEPVKVLKSFHSFRPGAIRNWYLRPATIFEAKALANTMLYLLEITGSVEEVAIYFRRVYLDNVKDLEPDYLFLLDTVAQIHEISDFAAALDTGRADMVRHLLVVTSSLGWFALQAPPALRGRAEVGSAGGNPVLRLFAAMLHFKAYVRKGSGKAYGSMQQLFADLEKEKSFPAFDQPPIAVALESTRESIRLMREQIGDIWNPNVRARFARVLEIMSPHFEKRQDTYQSYMGMPNNGNARSFVRTKDEMELFYHDHAPGDDYAEWLKMRGSLLFTHVIPHEKLVSRLDQHFQAIFLVYPCDHCGSLFHQFWVSRFADDFTAVCPVSGHSERIKMADARRIALGGG